MSDSFYDLCRKYDSIKTREKYDNYCIHLMQDVYPAYFEPRRQAECCILEIGSFKGGGLRALKEFFPNAHIIGIDKDAKTESRGRITVINGDQTDAAFLKSVCEKHGPFLFVLEDGCHFFEAQRISYETVIPYVAQGGYYFIEDVVTPEQPGSDGIFNYIKEKVVLPDALVRNKTWGWSPVKSVAFHRGMIAIQRSSFGEFKRNKA